MPTNATQPDQAEGERDDEQPGAAEKGAGQGRSSEEPVEGSDDAPAGGRDSPA
jgi:hypothetical protein